MAWKEHSELKPENKLYEEKKQAMIVAENALAHATQIVMGLGASGLDKFTLENVTKRVKETAADLFLWVFGQGELAIEHQKNKKQEPKKEESTTKTGLESATNLGPFLVHSEFPTPTLEQQKILELIAKKLAIPGVKYDGVTNELKQSILNWIKEATGKVGYPKKESSVDEFITWYKNKDKNN